MGPRPQRRERVSSGPAVEASGDAGPRPHRQEPGPLRTRRGRSRWGENEAGGGGASGAGALRAAVFRGPGGARARRGFVRGDTVSPAGLCARPSGLPAPGSGAAGPRVRVPAPRRLGSRSVLARFAVRGQVPGRCSRSRRSGRAGSLPPPRAGRGVRPVSATASWGIRCDGPASAGRSGQDGRGHWGRFLRVQGHRVVALHPCATSSVSVPSVLSSEGRPVASWLRFPPGHVVPCDAVVRGTVCFRRVAFVCCSRSLRVRLPISSVYLKYSAAGSHQQKRVCLAGREYSPP